MFCLKTNKRKPELKAGDTGKSFDANTGKLSDFHELNLSVK